MLSALSFFAASIMLASPASQPPHGEWEGLNEFWPVKAVHMIHLHTGKILAWGEGSVQNGTAATLFDPSDSSFTAVNAPDPWDLFCAGHAQLPNGNILVAGGGIHNNKAPFHSLAFVPTIPGWVELDQMLFRRWYPTCTTLPNGDISNFGGWIQDQPEGIVANVPELYQLSSSRWTAKRDGERWVDLYPYMFIMPNQKLFQAGPHAHTWFMNLSTWVWESPPIDNGSDVRHASAAMFDAVAGKILKCGGAPTAPSNQTNNGIHKTQVFSSGDWASVDSMNYERVNHNLVCLPDGTVLAVGGARFVWFPQGSPNSREPVMVAEIFDPDLEEWTPDPSTVVMARPRWYHSSAVLLRDGRVLVAGGDDREGITCSSNGQIYKPPYLYDDPGRAVILDAPAVMAYDTEYDIEFEHPDELEITKAGLTRLGSVTHGFDSDQRYIRSRSPSTATSSR